MMDREMDIRVISPDRYALVVTVDTDGCADMWGHVPPEDVTRTLRQVADDLDPAGAVTLTLPGMTAEHATPPPPLSRIEAWRVCIDGQGCRHLVAPEEAIRTEGARADALCGGAGHLMSAGAWPLAELGGRIDCDFCPDVADGTVPRPEREES